MKKKLNPIPKAYREKQRYILLEKDMEFYELFAILRHLFGITTVAKIGLKKEKVKIFKVNKDYLDYVLAALSYYSIKNNENKVLKISGTLKGLTK